jgi:hypothetical protein
MSTETGEIGEWKELHNVSFQDLYSESHIVRMMHTMKMVCLEHVTHRIVIGNCGAKD